MGCPGLNFIMTSEGLVYAFTKYMDDYELLREKVEELLIKNVEKNSAFINKKIYDEYQNLITDYRYPAFRKLVIKYSNYDINEIYDFVL
jgi:hypothetical protein